MSELTEDQKLVKLGIRSPNQTVSIGAELLEKLKGEIAESFKTFQEKFEDAALSSFGDLETWLKDNGFTSDEASTIRKNFEKKYSSFSEFNRTVIDDLESWGDFESEFSSGTGLRSGRESDSGLSAGGIKIYEEDGVGRSGQSIPAGGVEVYGKEVHFSQTSAVRDTKDESSGTSDPVVWDNLTVDPNSGQVGDKITVSCDVTNNTSYITDVVAELIVDGEVNRTNTIELGGNTTETVLFSYTAGTDGTGTFDIGLSKAGTEEVTVIYGGL